ncbi:MAG: hypothetical protein KBT34_14505 [Prevotella sp.]|nr:hypothetical protein [Candidatus Prevotella equi]
MKLMIKNAIWCMLLLLASCAGVDDIHLPDDGKPEEVTPLDEAVVTQLQRHTAGKGYPVVIMGDGFTKKALSDGTYRSATQKIIDALFAYEPMTSLRQYIDIYEITAVSTDNGVTTTKGNTAFSTHLVGGNSTTIYGDSINVLKYGAKALSNNIVNMNRAMYIVFLNSDKYAGITMLSADTTVTDSIPSGFSLSYIPVYAKTDKMSNEKLLPLLVQHEVVGHGIAKLADEYHYLTDATASDVKQYYAARKHGLFMNIHYEPNQIGTKYDRLTEQIGTVKKTYDVYKHDVEDYCFFAPLVHDAQHRYDSENLCWYEGANVFPKNFYRPTLQSMMNETLKSGNDFFNAPSRVMIYKRIMREAFGTSFSCDLTKTEDYNRFVDFDAPSIAKPLSARGIKNFASSVDTQDETLPLPPPILIK